MRSRSEFPTFAPGRSTVTSRHVMRRGSGEVAEGAEAALDRASGSSGAPLPADLRGRFESSLGADLSSVRVHTGAASADAAAAVGARAYATGDDVHFGAGEYDPASRDGQFLIAHEVAHTVQQRGGAGGAQYKLEVSSPGDPAEVEADVAAAAMMSGGAAVVTGGGGVARKVMRSATGEGGGGEKIQLTLPEVKLAKKKLSFFECEAVLSGQYEIQRKSGGAKKEDEGGEGKPKEGEPGDSGAPSAASDGYDKKHADGKTEGEVKATAEKGAVGVSAEVSKKFSALGFEPTVKGGIDFNNKKVKVGASCEFSCEWGPVKPVFTPLEFTLLEWEPGKAPKFAKVATSVALEVSTQDVVVDGETWNVKPSLKLELEAEPDPAEAAKWVAEHAAELLAGEALITVGLIAGGVLTIGAALYQIAKSNEFTERTEPEVKKCRAYCEAYSQVMKGQQPGGGEGAAEGAAHARARLAEIKGHYEEGAVTEAFAKQDFYRQAWAQAWPQVKRRCIDSYWEEHWLEKKIYGADGAGSGGFRGFKMLLDGWDTV